MHPATLAVLRFFSFEHLHEGFPKEISRSFHGMAWDLARALPADPETTVALRHLLEAKEAAVRAALGVPIPTE